MRNFLLLGLIGLLLNCDNKKISEPKPAACGNFLGLKNRQEWIAAPTASFINRDTINLMVEECTVPQVNGSVEWLSLNQLPVEPGTYALRPNRWDDFHGTPLSAWLYKGMGQSENGDRYNLLATRSEKNEVTIDSYNPASREIRGRLNATFVTDPENNRSGQSRHDTIRIRDAVFTLVVAEAK
ncbi:hypothetical protein [Larkinella soli]|uniref:hypothetical protein n=1 Tax=Larkinella soli TaxID=1770527 RepID=UPI000FFC7344|nr:hypothetical protein [Larkinella soli]